MRIFLPAKIFWLRMQFPFVVAVQPYHFKSSTLADTSRVGIILKVKAQSFRSNYRRSTNATLDDSIGAILDLHGFSEIYKVQA